MSNKIIVVIPALNPDEKLIETIDNLIKNNVTDILVINDGSQKKYLKIFEKVEEKNIKVISHNINKGKGRALKTAFEYITKNKPECIGVVTADADGQHCTKDIINIIKELNENKDKLILGVRTFNKDVPIRSKIGNFLARISFKVFNGISLRDTQSGLRGIPGSYVKKLIDIDGERFEFEMNMLAETKEKKIDIKQVNIETIYINNNKGSNFKTIRDSIKVVGQPLKYLSVSIVSFILDIGIFNIMTKLLKQSIPNIFIIASTVIARTVSSIFNFTLNKKIVFKASKNTKKQMLKYYSLCILQMISSALLVNVLYNVFKGSETKIKIIVDVLLFSISFSIQKKYVFKKEKKTCG